MAEETPAQLAPHPHECPVVGCHTKYECHGADCARFYFKNCEKHAIAEKPLEVLAAPPSKTKNPASPPAEG